MKDSEFLRVIEEICITLKLSRPCITQVITFYKLFQNSETHSYKIEIVIIACIYLSCKINEQMRRTRDILNMAFIVTSFYKKRNKELAEKDPETFKNKITYVSLEHLKEEAKKSSEGDLLLESGSSDWFVLENLPEFSLEKYNTLRDESLKAEQHLLRILNYNLENKHEAYYQLLFKVLESHKFPKELNERILAVYNDSFFLDLENVKEDWRVLFSIFVTLNLFFETSAQDKAATDFKNKFTGKLEKDFACKEALQTFTKSLLEYYNEIEPLP